MHLVIDVDSNIHVIVFNWAFKYEVVFDVRDIDMCHLILYLILELGPSIRRLDFGENIHVEVLYSEVRDHIWSILAYLRDEEWENLPLPLARIELGNVFCFELVRDSEF